MIREETFNGEVVQTTSPIISEQEATMNAGFGQYDYDPGARAMRFDSFSRYMNPPSSGIGMPPPGAMANPLLQQTQYQQQEEQLRTFIKPCNIGGEYLPPIDWEDKVNKKILSYMDKYDEQAISQQQQGYGYNYYGMNNYYGTPYFSPYNNYNPITNEIMREVEDMKNEARENRIAFNKLLSRTAHKFANEDAHEITEQELDDRYRGKYVDVPGYVGMTNVDLSHQNMLARLVPFDNSAMYRAADKAVSDEFHKIIPETADLYETFGKSALLKAEYDLEEEHHRRNNAANLYNSNDGTYRAFVKAKAAERYKNKNNINPMQAQIQNQTQVVPDTFPTLQQCAKYTEDGTLSISFPCNFGSHQGELYTVNNSQESEYEQTRERFTRFYNSIPGAFSVTDPNPDHRSG